jgi:hypothetical protein
MSYDQNNIRIKRTHSTMLKSDERKSNINDDRKLFFCYKIYEDWTHRDIPFDIPILIMDNKSLEKNKDIYTIPRLYAKYAYKKVKFPFVYEDDENQYISLNRYFHRFLKKDVPSCEDFKSLLMEKMMIQENQEFYESVNLFLYTSFLLRQFACVMKLIPYFYSPICDETKYYFYMCVDFLRRKSIKMDKPLMKSEILYIIKMLSKLNGKVLNKESFRSTFVFLDDDFFENDESIFLQNETFLFSKEKINNC